LTDYFCGDVWFFLEKERELFFSKVFIKKSETLSVNVPKMNTVATIDIWYC